VTLRATYRLQLGGGLDFDAVRELVPYLRDLGVSHLYLSPSFQARPGSTHGYDVVDPRRISEELGGERAFRELAGAGLGVILDIVPNHMAAVEDNRYWADERLRARFFDVDPATGAHRRFFDIDHLAGVRQEDPEVFRETHALAFRLVREGLVEGLRIDHPDGLADPAAYLRRLRDEGVERVWVEKILDPGERLRDWPVQGTVGYEFLNDAAALFVDPSGERPLTELYAEVTGERRPFAELAFEAKLEQASTTFRPEVERLRRLHPADGLERALASLPVYRTYVEPHTGVVEEADREALAGNPLRSLLLLEEDAPAEFVTRFQQTTPPVMAKGVEDTAFYRYNRLVALNEVGGDPSRFGLSVEGFHRGCLERARRFPRGLLITQTHDTKRSGDVRARIGALAGIPGEWREHVTRWFELVPEQGPPDPCEACLIFQTLVGAWPIDLARLEAYVEKALREAKRSSSWVEPHEAWEAGAKRFCRRLYGERRFRDDFEPFAERVARLGERAALGQTLLKLTAPGVPDVYQGDELWALSLVDPDNRRPVDWGRRREALDSLRAGAAPERETVKLFLIWRALELRARRAEAFAGEHRPVEAGEACCAYLRGGEVLAATATRVEGEDAVLLIPEAAAGRWRDALGGGELELRGEVPLERLRFGEWPLALLERVGR
jgi:(1->4)-alpha-D-glucan 1-alpha-D-glucosylmutase